MARSRSIPVNLFRDPDVVELANDQHRLFLVCLVLCADDEGRGSAHPKVLAYESGVDITPQQIEQAMVDLQAHELVQCYQVGRHHYYALPRWSEWETLSKPTPSKYPAPPQIGETSSCPPFPGLSQISQGTPDMPREPIAEGEEELEAKRNEGEEKGLGASNVLTFPSPAADQYLLTSQTALVARILKLSESDGLRCLVHEYAHHVHLSLEGEAYSAREWIDDRQRNRKGQRMTPAFYRRWIKRELEMQRTQEALRQQQATGTDGTGHRLGATEKRSRQGPGNERA